MSAKVGDAVPSVGVPDRTPTPASPVRMRFSGGPLAATTPHGYGPPHPHRSGTHLRTAAGSPTGSVRLRGL